RGGAGGIGRALAPAESGLRSQGARRRSGLTSSALVGRLSVRPGRTGATLVAWSPRGSRWRMGAWRRTSLGWVLLALPACAPRVAADDGARKQPLVAVVAL